MANGREVRSAPLELACSAHAALGPCGRAARWPLMSSAAARGRGRDQALSASLSPVCQYRQPPRPREWATWCQRIDPLHDMPNSPTLRMPGTPPTGQVVIQIPQIGFTVKDFCNDLGHHPVSTRGLWRS